MLSKCGSFTEEVARFFIAEIAMAVQSVHDLGFMHRDVKVGAEELTLPADSSVA